MVEKKLKERGETNVYINWNNRWVASPNADYSLAVLEVSEGRSLS